RSSAASSGHWPMARWRPSTTDRDRARSRRSRRKRKPGWYLWRAIRPRSTAIRTSCGRRGFWPVMGASVDRRRGTNLSPIWSRARCPRSSAKRASSRTRCATTWNGATPAAIVSYDEKPGIQVIATTAPDLPPVPNVHATFARDHEYKRHGTLSLLAGIDLLTGKVYALVRDRHRSREFIEFLKLLDAAYPASTAIKLILDNHSAHISRETRAWLDTRPPGRFDFTFTPKHGSWLNLIEGFFSK